MVLDREKEQARENRTQECKAVRQARASLLAEHCTAEDEPAFDEADNEEQAEPAEEDGEAEGHGRNSPCVVAPVVAAFAAREGGPVEVPGELVAASVLATTPIAPAT